MIEQDSEMISCSNYSFLFQLPKHIANFAMQEKYYYNK